MHTQSVAGDTVIQNTLISSQGDDGINLNNLVQPVMAVGAAGTSATLSTYPRFISVGDTLAFFDAYQNFLGTAHAVSATPLGGLNYNFTLDAAIPGLASGGFVRDLALISSRVAVLNSVIENCECRGILLQTPNSLVSGNQIINTPGGGIEATTGFGGDAEGVGAINDIIANNFITNAGFQPTFTFPWASISSFGAIAPLGPTIEPSATVNSNLVVTGNTVSVPFVDGCITMANVSQFSVTLNICNVTNKGEPTGSPSIAALYAAGGSIQGNTRFGATTGPIIAYPATTQNVQIQPVY